MATDIVERLRRLPPSPIAFGDSEADKRNRAERGEAADEIERLRGLLTRCETILGNMALENEGKIFSRWRINHEPLRADAKNILPEINEALP